MLPPINIKKWIDEHRHLLKPPVGNQVVYKGNDDFIVMIVGGPNARKDYHYNEGEELFYQFEGDIVLDIMVDNKPQKIEIKEGDFFLLPPKVPHRPVRPANTVGLVIERYRKAEELDAFLWFCENCGEQLYKEYAHVLDIVTQLPEIMNRFYTTSNCTCKKCGTVMMPPVKVG
jgi:3-hydroxyanthranilate 3,4-dioxygenase